MTDDRRFAIPFDDLGADDVPRVGGKNASLGEMVGHLAAAGVRVPAGFATTAEAFRLFLSENGLDAGIAETLAAEAEGRLGLAEAGARIRAAILAAEWPEPLRAAILGAYRDLARREGIDPLPVAVRSSATAEDLPDASFAGQQETFLNVRGEAALLDACRRCLASLYTDRAISYRAAKGFEGTEIALSVGVQRMVRSDLGAAGVMFTLDTETGFDRVVLIDAAWGLGETVVQGTVDPDAYQVFKPHLEDPDLVPILHKRLGAKAERMILAEDAAGGARRVRTPPEARARFVLEDAEILALARLGVAIEAHYGRPMDVEWAKDGETGELFVVQARPETVRSRDAAGAALRTWRLTRHGERLLEGLAIGEGIVAGEACLIRRARDVARFVEGSILVTSTTDPDWVPVMRRAAAIVTDHGGRTSHAAIVSRELGLPAVVGAGRATEALRDGQAVTVSCAEGDAGAVYDGLGEIETTETPLHDLPETRTRIMLNLADPGAAFRWWRLPADGVGLARMEFVVGHAVRAHPMALARFEALPPGPDRDEIERLTAGFADRREYFVDALARGLSRIAAVGAPNPVVVRTSDFKTNEYAALLGGAGFEPAEENPMLGFRGASRYYAEAYREGFALECRALGRLRGAMGFRNVVVMIPFCRTVGEAEKVLAVMAENGLRRGEDGLEVLMMCEIPANVILAEDFARLFDGFSIGSNDLTQLTLGVDRDSEALAGLFDARDPAVLWMIRTVIAKANAAGARIGFCGQAPSDDPDYARLLVEAGIGSISVTPDSFAAVRRHVAAAERALGDSPGR